MRGTFDYLSTATDGEIGYPADGNRLVQRWAWYSLNDKRFEGYTTFSHLFDPYTNEITPLGLDFEAYAAPLYTPYVDLRPLRLDVRLAEGPPATVTLTATVRNTGNVDVHQVPVTFWQTAPGAGNRIGAVQTIADLPARSRATVSIDWLDVEPGAHTVGVTVDGEDAIVESDEGNNRLSNTLLVGGERIYLPFSVRGR
jgi:hypothetical protein